MKLNSCILCNNSVLEHFHEDTTEAYSSDYYQCQHCRLIFAPPKDRPAKEDEFARYETHENDPQDKGYRNFLSQLFNPLNDKLQPKSKGLDFGCGPGPTLNLMFEEEGHSMNIYDPFYADDEAVFEENYDFITATEVLEHLFYPGEELRRLWSCLRPCGYLGIMTEFARDDREYFAEWHYRLDYTHVSFFTKDTFRFLANQWDASIEFYGNRVVIFQKPDS